MKSRKSRVIFSVVSLLVMIIGAGAGLYILQKENLELRREADVTREASLLLVPLDQLPLQIEPNDTFEVTVYLNTGGYDVVGTDIILEYSDNLSLENIAPPQQRDFLTYAPVNSADGTFDVETAKSQDGFGTVTFDWDNTTTPIQNPINDASIILATLTFKALSEGEGSVSIAFNGVTGTESTADSNVVHIDVNGNVYDILQDPDQDGYISVLVSTTPIVTCVDNDGDGFNTYDETNCPLGTDCDDSDADVNPQAEELCNGKDDDCDNSIDENLSRDCVGDESCQGTQQCSSGSWGNCVCPLPPCEDSDEDGYDAYDASSCPLGNDCDDTNANIHPQANESCNSVDDNCDGNIDENLTQDCTGPNDCQGTQQCTDGQWDTCSCPIVCEDSDGDGFNAYNASTCYLGTDCDDTNANIHPQANELCNNVDDNCDDQVDENVTEDCTGGNGCPGSRECTNGSWLACDCPITCVDNDGDGYDEYDTVNCPLGTDCNDTDGNIHPQADELCNNTDDNCNDQVDENLTQSCPGTDGCQGTQQCENGSWDACICPTVCEDNDSDGYDAYDASTCPLGTDCNDADENIHPQATELCNNIDDNCNDQVDENLTQQCSGANGCEGNQECTNGSWETCVCESQVCEPQCKAYQCGGDACEGSCGTCSTKKICHNNKCISINRGKKFSARKDQQTVQLSVIIGEWNSDQPTDERADVNNDGEVNIYDASYVTATDKDQKPPTEKEASLFLSISDPVEDIILGEEFTVDVMVDTNDEEVVGVTADITYPSETLEVVSVSSSASVFDTAIEEKFVNGTVELSQLKYGKSFTGRGRIASIRFKPIAVGDVTFTFKSDDAVMNNGAYNVLGEQDGLTVSVSEKDTSLVGRAKDAVEKAKDNPVTAVGIAAISISAIAGLVFVILKIVRTKRDSGTEGPPKSPSQKGGVPVPPPPPLPTKTSVQQPVATSPGTIEEKTE